MPEPGASYPAHQGILDLCGTCWYFGVLLSFYGTFWRACAVRKPGAPPLLTKVFWPHTPALTSGTQVRILKYGICSPVATLL